MSPSYGGWRLDHGHDRLCFLILLLLLDMTMELAGIWTKCVCDGVKLLCFRYLWTRFVITMCTLMYEVLMNYLWNECNMWLVMLNYCDLSCMQVGLKSFVVSVDYRVYMGSSMTVWSLRWLLLYLCSYKLVGSVTAGIRARFNIKHVICVFKTKIFFLQKSVFTTYSHLYIGVFKSKILPKCASGHILYAQIRTFRWLI